MQCLVLEDHQSVSHYVAKQIRDQVTRKADSVLGLATGNTPEQVYALLVKWSAEDPALFSRVHTVNLDEYVGLAPEHENSYHHYMRAHFFSHVQISKERMHIPRGDSPSAEQECNRYEKTIQKLGGIDLQLLGIGSNGHIGFNEPGMALRMRTHVTDLDDRTLRDNVRLFKRQEDMPTKAITMGIGTIFQAKRIVLMATGKQKREALRKMMSGTVDPRCPASILQLHPNATVIVDRAAL